MKIISQEEKLKADIQVIINYFNVGSYNDVINKSIPLIKKYPETYILKNLLALAYNSQNKYKEAIKVLDGAIKNDPNNIFILNNLGLVHSNL